MPTMAGREAVAVELVDLVRGRFAASTRARPGESALAVFDERQEPVPLAAPARGNAAGIDLSRERRLTLRSTDPKLGPKLVRAGFPVVRLLGSSGELLATLPLVR